MQLVTGHPMKHKVGSDFVFNEIVMNIGSKKETKFDASEVELFLMPSRSDAG